MNPTHRRGAGKRPPVHEALGLECPAEILLLPPAKYIDLRKATTRLRDALEYGQRCFLKLRLGSNIQRHSAPGRPPRASFIVEDGAESAHVNAFGATAQWDGLRRGGIVHMLATVELWQGRLSVKAAERVPAHELGRLAARYSSKGDTVHPAVVERAVARALQEHLDEAVQRICTHLGMSETEIVRGCAIEAGGLRELIWQLHRPPSPEAVTAALGAIRRVNALGELRSRERSPSEAVAGAALSLDVEALRALIEALPFQPTRDQRRAAWEIVQDLLSERPMDRVLTGDVGSGKTLAYALPSVAAQQAGHQVVILMPNLLLAEQVEHEIRTLFPGARTVLMVSGHEVEGPLEGNPIVVGTSSILHYARGLDGGLRVDLLVVDEQQKFSAEQRALVASTHTNRLEATATPIPRTAALMRFGGKQISRIRELPVHKEIRSRIVGPDRRRDILRVIERTVEGGAKAVVLYPNRCESTPTWEIDVEPEAGAREKIIQMLESNGIEPLEPVGDPGADIAREAPTLVRYQAANDVQERLAATLKAEGVRVRGIAQARRAAGGLRGVEEAAEAFGRRFPGRVAMLHGGLGRERKVTTIQDIREGRYDIIVTTSVLEIGITIPELRTLYVVDAHNYGATTLHQIRGRLARQGGKGLFLMGVDRELDVLPEKTRARLELVASTTDGFEIAQGELHSRGFGRLALDAKRQSGFGETVFKNVAVTPEDVEALLECAQRDPGAWGRGGSQTLRS